MGFVAQLKNVDFGYADRLILENISLDIPKGKVVSVMGGSGWAKLLCCVSCAASTR